MTFSTSAIWVAVAAQQPVRAQQPDVARHGHCRLRHFGRGVFVGEACRDLLGITQQCFKLFVGEADQLE